MANEETKVKRAPLPTDVSSLKQHAQALTEKLRKNRFEKVLGQLADTSLIRKNRRELARTLTALHAAEKGASK